MSNQTVSKKTKKEMETATKQTKDTFTEGYKHLFQEMTMLPLHTKEQNNFTKYVNEKVKDGKSSLPQKKKN
jgi:hypothetical protein